MPEHCRNGIPAPQTQALGRPAAFPMPPTTTSAHYLFGCHANAQHWTNFFGDRDGWHRLFFYRGDFSSWTAQFLLLTMLMD